MSSARHASFVIAAALVFAGLSAMATPPAEPNLAPSAVPSASAAAAPAASASSSSARTPRMPPPEPLESQSIPKEPSPVPKLEEWKTAIQVAVKRRSTESLHCRAFLIREWLKIKCDLLVAAIQQHGGSPDNVFFWIGDYDGFSWDVINGGEVILPMRPGDQRVIEFFRMFPETCFGRQALPWIIVDETWVEGDANPTVVIR